MVKTGVSYLKAGFSLIKLQCVKGDVLFLDLNIFLMSSLHGGLMTSLQMVQNIS